MQILWYVVAYGSPGEAEAVGEVEWTRAGAHEPVAQLQKNGRIHADRLETLAEAARVCAAAALVRVPAAEIAFVLVDNVLRARRGRLGVSPRGQLEVRRANVDSEVTDGND